MVDAADLQGRHASASPTPAELADLLFAWRVCKFVKSNAIVYARGRATIGVGAGQMSRVYSSRVAAMKAADEKLEVAGAVMASDAFFPFRDGLDVAAELRHHGRDPAGRLEARRRSDRRGGRARHGDGVHRHAAFPALIKLTESPRSSVRRRARARLAWKVRARQPRVTEVFVAPGNAGTATEPKVRNVEVAAEDVTGLVATSRRWSASTSPSSGRKARWWPASSMSSRRAA